MSWLSDFVDSKINTFTDEVPEGWATYQQICEEFASRMGRSTESGTLRRKVRAFLEGLPKQKFRIKNGNRGIYPVAFYQVAKL